MNFFLSSDSFSHLVSFCIRQYRTEDEAFAAVASVTQFLSRKGQTDAEYLIANRTWFDIIELAERKL